MILQRLSHGRCREEEQVTRGAGVWWGRWVCTSVLGGQCSQSSTRLTPCSLGIPANQGRAHRVAGRTAVQGLQGHQGDCTLTRMSSSPRPGQLETFARHNCGWLIRLTSQLGQMLPAESASSPSTPACSSKCQDKIRTALFSWGEGHGRVLPDAWGHDTRGEAAPGLCSGSPGAYGPRGW